MSLDGNFAAITLETIYDHCHYFLFFTPFTAASDVAAVQFYVFSYSEYYFSVMCIMAACLFVLSSGSQLVLLKDPDFTQIFLGSQMESQVSQTIKIFLNIFCIFIIFFLCNFVHGFW